MISMHSPGLMHILQRCSSERVVPSEMFWVRHIFPIRIISFPTIKEIRATQLMQLVFSLVNV